jgi:hypothetical protein
VLIANIPHLILIWQISHTTKPWTILVCDWKKFKRLVLSESKIFKAFISQSETIISHGGHAFLCNIHSKIMNFYEGVSREIYEKSKSNEQ